MASAVEDIIRPLSVDTALRTRTHGREDFVAGPAFAVAGIPTAGGAPRRAPDGLDGRGHSGWKDDLLTLAAPDLARSG